MIRQLTRIMLCILLYTLSTTQVFAVENYTEIFENLYIRNDVYAKLLDESLNVYPLFVTKKEDTFSEIINNIQRQYNGSLIENDSVDNLNFIKSNKISTDIGNFEVWDDSFLDAISIHYEQDEKYSSMQLIADEAWRWKIQQNKSSSDEVLNFSTPEEAIKEAKIFLKKLGINGEDLVFQIHAMSKQNFLDFEQYYNENFSDFNGKISSEYVDVYIIYATRKLGNLNFLTNYQEIGNFESGTNVRGEGYTFIVGDNGVLFGDIINYFSIDFDKSIENVEENKTKLLELIKNKFNSLLLVDAVFVDKIDTIYTPYPIGDVGAEKRNMVYQPIWVIDVKFENSYYDKNNPAQSNEFFDVQFYFNIKGNKEILN